MSTVPVAELEVGWYSSDPHPWTATAPWTIAGVGDLDNDGKADITWRNPSTGRVSFWLMDRFTPTLGAQSRGPPPRRGA